MKTWRKYRTYKRIQKLWLEYKEAAQNELSKHDVKLVTEKLSAFLEAFQQSYVEFKAAGHEVSLDSFYGDCSEVLVSLLDLVDRHFDAGSGDALLNDAMNAAEKSVSDPEAKNLLAEVIHKALRVAELIVGEEKYMKEIATTAPQIIDKVISLLETSQTPEAKTTLLRMIASISQSGMETRLQIGRLDGYRKVLRLLVEGEDGLSRAALSTIQHFLEVQDGQMADEDAPPQLKEAINQGRNAFKKYGLNLTVSPSSVWNTTKVVVREMQRLYAMPENTTAGDPDQSAKGGTDSSPSSRPKDHADSEADEPGQFPPSRVSIARKIEELELEVKANNIDEEAALAQENLTPRAYADFLATEHAQPEGHFQEDELMRELIGVQGALRSLTSKLAEAARDVQLDVMATISILLRNSRRNKREFRSIDGYSLLLQVFRGIKDYSAPTSQVFLDQLFGIMYTIILDGNQNTETGNLDALELVFHLVNSSDLHVEVRTRALNTIQELLIANPLNVVSCRRVKGLAQLLSATSDIKLPVKVEGKVGQTTGELRLLDNICETLTYAAVLLSRHDSDIVEDMLRFAISSKSLHHPVRHHLLLSVRDALRDRNSRQLKPVPMSFVTDLTTALRSAAPSQAEQADMGEASRPSSRMSSVMESGEEDDDDRTLSAFMRVPLTSSRSSKWTGTIVMLEALAHALHASQGAHVPAFFSAEGFDMLVEWFCSEAPSSVVSLSLWLILELIGLAVTNIVDLTQTVVKLLEMSRLTPAKRMLLLSMMRTWLFELQASSSSSEAAHTLRMKLRDGGAVQALQQMVGTGGPKVAREALVVLGSLVTATPKLKHWFEGKIGCVPLSQTVIESAIKPDLSVLEVLLLIADNSQLEYIIAPHLLVPSSAPTDLICNTVLNVRRPAPRYASSLQSSTNESRLSRSLARKGSQESMQRAEKKSDVRPRSASNSLKSEETTRSSKFHNKRATSTSSNNSSDATLDLEQLLSGFTDVDIKQSAEEADAINKRLAVFTLRSSDAAFMVLSVLAKANDKTQERVLGVLMSAMALNPANGDVMSKMEGLTVVLGMINRCSPGLKGTYLRFLSSIGQYTVTPEEVRLLFELAMPLAEARESEHETEEDNTLKLQVMSIIGSISERVTPPSFFHLDGRAGWLKFHIERFPVAKVGYTMQFWLRVTSFQGEESTFLRWYQGGGMVLELYFQRIGAQGDAARCLSVRTQEPTNDSTTPPGSTGSSTMARIGSGSSLSHSQGQLFAFNAFNAHSFSADGQWHHVTFSQCNRTLSLYLDGAFVQSCSFTTYPVASKDKTLVTGMIGGDETRAGFLSGEFSSVTIAEGVLDAKVILSAFEEGPLFGTHSMTTRAKGAETARTLMLVHPKTCIKGCRHLPAPMVDLENLRTDTLSDLIEDVFDRFTKSSSQVLATPSPERRTTLSPEKSHRRTNSADMSNKSRKGDKDAGEVVLNELGGWIQAHGTRCLQDVVQDVGGMRLALRLLAPRRVDTQIPALRILSGLLVRWAPNRQAFVELQGYCVLLYILSQSELTLEVFDILLEIATHGKNSLEQRGALKDPDCCLLMTDLLPLCAPPLQRKILRAIEDSFMSSPNTACRLWMDTAGLGLPIILNFLRTMASSLYNTLLSIFSQLAPYWGHREVDLLCSFVIGDQQVAVEGKAQILDIMNQRLSTGLMPIDSLRTPWGFDVVLCLLDHRAERIRVGGMQMLGTLLTDPKTTKMFVKMSGFDAARRVLVNHKPTAASCLAMLQLVLGNFGSKEGTPQANSRRIAHPGAVQAMLALIAAADDQELQCTALGTLEMLTEDPVNVQALLAAGALDWLRALLFPETEDNPSSSSSLGAGNALGECGLGEKAELCARDIVGRLVVGALSDDLKLLKIKELCDYEGMHAVVTQQVLAHFERDPRVSSTSSTPVLRSLAQLLEPLIEVRPTADPSVYLQAVRAINRIANQNSDAVRSSMKETALLELRDSLLIHSLKLPLTRDGAFAIMQGFSFEWVAEKSAFREANGLAHLLDMFHAFPDQPDLQIGVGCVLRNVLCTLEENKKAVSKLVDDTEVAKFFFPSYVHPAVVSMRAGDDEDMDPSEESARCMTVFLEWYYDEEQKSRREAVEGRVNKVIQQAHLAMQKACEKAIRKRGKRLKIAQERHAKVNADLFRALLPWEEQRKVKVREDVAANTWQEKAWTQGFQERLSAGEKRWLRVEEEISSTQTRASSAVLPNISEGTPPHLSKVSERHRESSTSPGFFTSQNGSSRTLPSSTASEGRNSMETISNSNTPGSGRKGSAGGITEGKLG